MTDRPTLAQRIRKRAQKAQREGKAGKFFILRLLASEAKTIKEEE